MMPAVLTIVYTEDLDGGEQRKLLFHYPTNGVFRGIPTNCGGHRDSAA
jgi:hypothetical protein